MICRTCGREVPQGMAMCSFCGTLTDSYSVNDSANINVVGSPDVNQSGSPGVNQSGSPGVNQSGSPVGNPGGGMNNGATGGGFAPLNDTASHIPPAQGAGLMQQGGVAQPPTFDHIYGVDSIGAEKAPKQSFFSKSEKKEPREPAHRAKPRFIAELDSFGAKLRTDHVGVMIIFCALMAILGSVMPMYADEKSAAVYVIKYVMFGYGIGKIAVFAAVACIVFTVMGQNLLALVGGFVTGGWYIWAALTVPGVISKGDEAVYAALSRETGFYIMILAAVLLLITEVYNLLLAFEKISYEE